ncbi:MAG: sugar phosphate isomerase/epimerase [Balneolaceae bacterium]|nr:sugar phosphate isomerase/epimerase [Balneolaceae bacterium]MBO6545777.1 sugar phosphate isomerase/epimerase [Balneolaceae bacterium]MBO6647173.1 sugar phosphate isomerase/epimerase [Balneolaceae bacterium]
MISRKEFINKAGLFTSGALLVPQLSKLKSMINQSFNFTISLAEWCLNKELFSGEIDHLNFPVIAKKEYGIGAVEYVTQFFPDKATDFKYLADLKNRADDHGVTSVLIMVDHGGFLSSEDESVRKESVEKHFKWIDAAKFLECHSVRVNLHGALDLETWTEASINSLGTLAEYGKNAGVSVIVENHGSHSSHGGRLAHVLKQVNSDWAGTLPDFGNFCYKREGDALWNTPCVAQYDIYEGTKELMPYAKGVSAKTFNFDEDGNESSMDYIRLFKIIKESGFNNGYVGIEYEGDSIPANQGIKLTKSLLEKVREELN